jgi:hypothetical protein
MYRKYLKKNYTLVAGVGGRGGKGSVASALEASALEGVPGPNEFPPEAVA